MLLFKADVMTDPERYLSLCRDADLHESITFSSEDHQHSLLTMCLHYGLKPVLMAITKASMTPGLVQCVQLTCIYTCTCTYMYLYYIHVVYTYISKYGPHVCVPGCNIAQAYNSIEDTNQKAYKTRIV